MKTYNLSAVVGVSAYTKIKANSPEEALEIAKGRPVILGFVGAGSDESESWVIDDADGVPTDIAFVP